MRDQTGLPNDVNESSNNQESAVIEMNNTNVTETDVVEAENEIDDDDDETDGEEESGDDDDDDETENDGESTEEFDYDDDDETESDRENISVLPGECPTSPNSAPTCYICLNIFEGQDIGSPDSCESMHHFCLECIEEWSKQINTCPVDRKSFSFIIVRRMINGEIVMKVPIAKKSVVEIVTMGDDVTYCEICGRCDREDRLLLCDGCDFGYHCECLVPPLETIPVDEWFCPDCFERLFGDDVHDENNQRQLARRRALARTGAFERVRNRILARRSNVTRTVNSTPRKKKKRTKRRKTSKKRKIQKTKNSTNNKSKKPRRKKYRKITRKSKMSMKRLPAADPRSRLATRLGLVCKPKSPFGMPITKPTSIRSLSEVRYTAGIGNLSLFGYELEMNHLRSYGDDSFDAVVAESTGSLGLLTNTRHHIFPIVNNKTTIKTPTEPLSLHHHKIFSNTTNVDVLSEIMNSQEILHASSCDLSIARDGRIYLNLDASGSSKNSIRQCPNSSPNHSSPPPTSSNGHSNTNNKNRNTNYSTSSSYDERRSSSNSYSHQHENTQHQEDISFIKPSPVVSLNIDNDDDKNIDIEMYSDIESLQDDKDNNKDLEDNNSNEENEISNNKQQKQQKQEKNDNFDQTNDDSVDLLLENSQKQSNSTDKKLSTSKDDNSITLESKRSTTVKIKRRPSINDLFGDGSEDEDDDVDKLKQLVAQQGSINVHFPIKMPIVLKTNFLSDKAKTKSTDDKDLVDDEVPISKKWIPIYPEMNKNVKNTGPKWKAIGGASHVDSEEQKQEEKKGESKKISNENNCKKQQNNNKKELNNSSVISTKLHTSFIEEMSDKNQDIFPVISSIQIKKPVNKSIIRDETGTLQDNNNTNNTSKKSTDKVRTCKHGRPISKNKELGKKRTTTSESSNMEIPLESKKLKENRKSDIFEDESNCKKKTSSAVKSDRNYKDETIDNNIQDSIKGYKDDKNSSKNNPLSARRKTDASDKYLQEEKHRTPRKSHREEHEKSSHTKTESKAIVCPTTTAKVGEKFKLSSNKQTSETTRDNRIRDSSKEESSSAIKKHRHHHHHHHRHHHRHKHTSESRHQQQQQQQSGQPQDKKQEKPETKPNIFQSYPKMQLLDSKEIIAKGDKIIINVNFKKQENKTNSSINEEMVKNDRKFDKSNTIETLSPDQSSSNSLLGKLSNDNNSIASPSNDCFENSNNNTSSSSSNKIKTSSLSSKELKNVLSDEFKFLPRIMPNNIDTITTTTNQPIISHSGINKISPPDDDLFIDDSFLPTPTQDESQSPILTCVGTRPKQSLSSNKSEIVDPTNISTATSTTAMTDAAKDSDFYDPELPLQSPDHFDEHSMSIKSPKIEKINYDSSMSSLKTSLMSISRDVKDSSLSSSMATAAAKLASLNNSINFSQILQFAQTLKQSQQNSQSAGGGSSSSKFTISSKQTQQQQRNSLSSSSTKETTNRDIIEIVDMDVDSPTSLSPIKPSSQSNYSSSLANVKEIWDQIVKTASSRLENNSSIKINNETNNKDSKRSKNDFLNTQPTSAVDMEIKEKYIKKLNRQERVVEEVKLALKPYYQKKKISKDEYKDILRKAVPKICHSKSGEINPSKIIKLVEAYIKHIRHLRKKS